MITNLELLRNEHLINYRNIGIPLKKFTDQTLIETLTDTLTAMNQAQTVDIFTDIETVKDARCDEPCKLFSIDLWARLDPSSTEADIELVLKTFKEKIHEFLKPL